MVIRDRLETWDGALPLCLVTPSASPEHRRSLLRSLAARALGLEVGGVHLEHRPDFGPRCVQPAGTALHLSSAGRGPLAALALAASPVGIDVEKVEPDLSLPFRVLHPAEARALLDCPDAARAGAFARLWACKEAYLKALGLGLSRGSETFEVRFDGAHPPRIRDEMPGLPVAEVAAGWHRHGGDTFAAAAVLLHPSIGRATTS